MAKDLAIVLNNGSINSAVVAALAGQKYRLVLLHAEVAQQPGSRVRAAYDLQVAHFKPFREAIKALAEKRIDVASLIHRRVRIDQGVEAMELAARPGVLKVLLTMDT